MNRELTIPDNVLKYGYLATLLKSTRIADDKNGKPRHIGLYERTKNGAKHYEVCIIKFVDAQVIEGRSVPARLSLPSPEKWGNLGWTYLNLGDSESKYDFIVEKYSRRAAA